MSPKQEKKNQKKMQPKQKKINTSVKQIKKKRNPPAKAPQSAKIKIKFSHQNQFPWLLLNCNYSLNNDGTKFLLVGFNPKTSSIDVILNDLFHGQQVRVSPETWGDIAANADTAKSFFETWNGNGVVKFRNNFGMKIGYKWRSNDEKFVTISDSSSCVSFNYSEYLRLVLLSDYINSTIFWLNSISSSITDYVRHYKSICELKKKTSYLSVYDFYLPEKIDVNISYLTYLQLFNDTSVYFASINNNNNNNQTKSKKQEKRIETPITADQEQQNSFDLPNTAEVETSSSSFNHPIMYNVSDFFE